MVYYLNLVKISDLSITLNHMIGTLHKIDLYFQVPCSTFVDHTLMKALDGWFNVEFPLRKVFGFYTKTKNYPKHSN